MINSRQHMVDVLSRIKKKILELEKNSVKVTEQDTRQGLINELFRGLGWNFSDFNLIKSEFRHQNYNEPVDYAFFSEKDKGRPLLLVEAKALGTDLDHSKTVKQLCTYLGEMGVQWGLLTDGNKYIMYNSKSGLSFEDQKFLTMQIKTANTDDGQPYEDLADQFMALLGKNCLENNGIQKAYKSHVINRYIEDALNSLLSEPFETLAKAIKNELKEEKIKVPYDLRIGQKQILSYLELIKDEEGRIPLDAESTLVNSDDNILHDIAKQEGESSHSEKNYRPKRIGLSDLLTNRLLQEGDSLRLESKGEVTWGRVTGNGEIEVDGKTFANPSGASSSVLHRTSNGWSYWKFRDSCGKWSSISKLREQHREVQHSVRMPQRKAA